MIQQPQSLHIPALYAEAAAPIEWGAVERAAGYRIERSFNEPFDQALTGCTWQNFETPPIPWSTYEQEDLTWQQIEVKPGKGRSWERLDYDQSGWVQIEGRQMTWQQIEDQDISFEIFRGPGTLVRGIEQGRNWYELDSLLYSWQDQEEEALSWQEGEEVTLPGLPWNGLDARWRTFAEWEEENLTFAAFEALMSPEQSRGMTDQIPIGVTSAIYRIQAYDEAGVESPWLTTDLLPVIKIEQPLIQQPQSLHIPTLYEGEAAPIEWATVELAAGYRIERNFNESFNQALTGCTWQDLETPPTRWSTYDYAGLTWRQIEAKRGKGRTWERLDYDRAGWAQIESRQMSWQQIEDQATSFEIFRGPGTVVRGSEQGRTWFELDRLFQSWQVHEEEALSWQEGEEVTLPGLPWNGLDARWRTFAEWEKEDLTFAAFEALQSPEQFRGMTDQIPIGAASAIYRIQAYDKAGTESPFLTTDLVPVIPIFYRSQALEYPVTAGRRYRILLQAKEVTGLDRVRMNLSYPSELLTLKHFTAHHPEQPLQAGENTKAQVTIYSLEPGKVWFQSTKPLAAGQAYSGALTLVEFEARQTGRAAIRLD